MANPFYINRIAVNPPIGKADVTFRAGLNIIRAVLTDDISTTEQTEERERPGIRNSVGKTTFVHLLDYGLGKTTFLPKDKKYGRSVLKSHDLLLELRLNGEEYTIERNLVDGDILQLYKGWVTDQLLMGEQLSSKPCPLDDYKVFLEGNLFNGLNIFEGSKFVSYRDVMQIIVREQVGGFESIDKAGNYYVNAGVKRKLLQFLTGQATSETLSVDNKVVQAEELEKEAKKALDIIKKYVDYKVNHTEELIRSELTSVEQEISENEQESEILKKKLITLQERSDERIEQKELLLRQRQALTKEVQAVQWRINSFQATLNEIDTEKEQINIAYHAHDILGSLKYEKCPVCLKPVTDELSVDDEKDNDNTDTIEIMKKILSNEKQDLIRSIEDMTRKLIDIRSQLRRIDEGIEVINAELTIDVSDILTSINELENKRQNLLGKQIGLQQDLDFYKDHEEYKRKHGVAKDHLRSMKAEKIQIQQKMKDSLEGLKTYYHEAVSYLYFANRVGSFNLSERAGNFQAEIRYLLSSEGKDTGAAAITLAVIAFDLALLKLAIKQNTPHPRLLVHDSPNIRDVDPIVYNRIFTYVTDILEKPFYENESDPEFQYIITTILMPEELEKDPYIRLELSNNGDEGKLFEFTF